MKIAYGHHAQFPGWPMAAPRFLSSIVVHVGDGEPGGAAAGGVRFVFSRMVNEHVADAGGALTSPAAPACR